MLPVKPLRLAVVGLGKVGQACAEALRSSHDLSIGAIVRRSVGASGTLPGKLQQVPVYTHIGQTRDIQGALICVPTNDVADVAYHVLQQKIPVVDCATLHGDAFHVHKEALHKLAVHHKTPAIVGAGWDPGALSMFRSWFALITPRGTTESTHRPGVSLHYTAMARRVTGVKDALCTEVRAADGRLQRYVYVELVQGANAEQVAEAIRADPLYMAEETTVFPVDTLAALEQEGQGVVLRRRSPPGGFGHHELLLEARIDEAALTASVMLAAARALPHLAPGAYALTELPLNLLWGEQAQQAERRWL